MQVSGSENDINDGLGNDIDSLNVSASYATSASFATTASFALNVVPINTGSFYTSSSVSDATITFTQGDGTTEDVTVDNVANAVSASFATTASYAENAVTPNLQQVTDEGNSTTNSLQTSNGGYTATLTGTSLSSNRAGGQYTITGTTTTSGGLILRGNSASTDPRIFIDGGTDSIYLSGSVESQDGITAPSFTGSITGTNANFTELTASSAFITSASIGYLETITGSAKIIGDAFIILNNDTPTERYAGVVVQDSGSTNNTASLLFDGQTNDWFYQYTDDGGATDEFGVVMFGPGYNTQGAHVYPSNNTILKGTGDHHIVDSSITDDGTLVSIDSNVSASGYVSASEFIGDGSGLTNLPATSPFPYDGTTVPAVMTGSVIMGVAGNVGNASNFTLTSGGKNGANSATGENAVSIGGQLHTNSGGHSFIGGGRNNDVNGANRAVIMAGNDNTLTGGNDDGYAIYNGSGNQINSNGGRNTTIIGGYINTIRNFWGVANDLANGYPREMYGLIAGGRSNQVGTASGNVGANGFPIIIGGLSNKIGETTVNNTKFTKYNTILNSSGSATDSGSFQNIYGGQGHYVSGSDNVTIIGGSDIIVDSTDGVISLGRTSETLSTADTTYVKSLDVKGRASSNVETLTITSNTASMDCSLGNMFSLTINQQTDVHLDATNVTAGQTINLAVRHDATNSGSLSFSGDFIFADGTAPTITNAASSKDLLSFVSFDSTDLYGTSLLNFS